MSHLKMGLEATFQERRVFVYFSTTYLVFLWADSNSTGFSNVKI